MPIYGSFANHLKDRKDNIHILVRETCKDGLKELEDSIRKYTPIKTGRLVKSLKRSKVKRIAPYVYEGSVTATAHYAKWVEYGTSPHVITPKTHKALSFYGSHGHTSSKAVLHPGAKGRHMFQIGTAEFSDVKLRPIMIKNLELYLEGGEAALLIT